MNDSFAVIKSLSLGSLHQKERAEVIKFILENNIKFSRNEDGEYSATIKVINPNYENFKNNNLKNNLQGTNSPEKLIKKKNANELNHPHDAKRDSLGMSIQRVRSCSEKRIKDYNDLFSKTYPLFYNHVKPMIGIRGKKIGIQQLRFQIEEAYSVRFLNDSIYIKNNLCRDSKISLKNPFPKFLYEFLQNKYVKKTIVDQQSLNILLSVEHFKETNQDIMIFSKFLTQEYDEDDLILFLFFRSCVEKETNIMFVEKAQDEIDLLRYEGKVDTEIYLNSKSCLTIAETVFGNDEESLIQGFMKKMEHQFVSEKKGIKASTLLKIALEEYHSTKCISDESEDTFFDKLIYFYKEKQIKHNLPKNDTLLAILNTYLQEKEINKFFERITAKDEANEDKKKKIKESVIKKITFLLSVLFANDRRSWFISLKIPKGDEKGNNQFDKLRKIITGLLSKKVVTNISENSVEEFCHAFFQTNELLSQIMKMIDNNLPN